MFQQITLVGYVGNEPTMRYTQDGDPVTHFNLAINSRYTHTDTDTVDETVWFRITTWRRQAEICAEYVHTGQLVLVVGDIKSPHTWIDQDGQAQVTLQVTAHTVKFLSGRQAVDELDGTEVDDSVVAAG